MDIKCTEKELFVFNKIAHTAQELQVPCYIIGGFVRDKIIGREYKGCRYCLRRRWHRTGTRSGQTL